uniref:FMRFa-like peptide 13 n=1 Tax=Ascaris suum TaxID=6253 RepID=D9I8P2_ASCSU|nr:FMRFa-like peptide precursor 13 [Ascaris suum]
MAINSISCLITMLAITVAVSTLESSEIRMLESEFLDGKRGNSYRSFFNPNEYTVVERRDSKLMDPLIRFGKRTNIMGENRLNRNLRAEGLSSPLIRFGKRTPPEEDLLGRFTRDPQQRIVTDETVLRFGRSSAPAAA